MALEKRKTNYIITNRIQLNKHRRIIENDLKNWINEKYVFCFKEHNTIKLTTLETIKKSIYIDGFDLQFDFSLMK